MMQAIPHKRTSFRLFMLTETVANEYGQLMESMDLQGEMQKVEAARLREAIIAESGNLARVADVLGMAKSTLTSKLVRNYEDLLEYARSLRDKRGEGRGRPRKRENERTRKAVTRAWTSSGRVYSVAAKELGIPASSCRELVHRYGLPAKPKPVKKPKSVKKTKRPAKRSRRKTRAN